jgi:hypothetical protein
MFPVVLLLVVLAAFPVLVVVIRRNAARAAAGYPAWSTYRARDPNAAKSGGIDWSDRDDSNGTWDDVFGGDSTEGGDVHGAVDAGDTSGDVGGGHDQ